MHVHSKENMHIHQQSPSECRKTHTVLTCLVVEPSLIVIPPEDPTVGPRPTEWEPNLEYRKYIYLYRYVDMKKRNGIEAEKVIVVGD